MAVAAPVAIRRCDRLRRLVRMGHRQTLIASGPPSSVNSAISEPELSVSGRSFSSSEKKRMIVSMRLSYRLGRQSSGLGVIFPSATGNVNEPSDESSRRCIPGGSRLSWTEKKSVAPPHREASMDEQTRLLFEAALRLPEDQRVLLAEELLESLPADAAEPVDDAAFAAELEWC